MFQEKGQQLTTLVLHVGWDLSAGLETIFKYKSEESFPSLQPDGVIV